MFIAFKIVFYMKSSFTMLADLELALLIYMPPLLIIIYSRDIKVSGLSGLLK